MIRSFAAAMAAAFVFLGFVGAARAQSEQQQLVDRATLTAQEMLNDRDGRDAQYVLRRARATIICPRVFRAGFLLGGSGGACVLVARDGAGSWSSPAFYGIGSASVGFQAGVEDAEVMMLILTDKGLDAIMDSQFKLGADANATFVDLGGGIEGGTTAALRADIVAFTRARGLYAGISLSGSLLSSRTDWDRAYYGRALAARQIVIGMEAANPAADGLREVLTRSGARDPGLTPTGSDAPHAYAPAPLQPAPPQPGAGPRPAPVQRQELPPPRR